MGLKAILILVCVILALVCTVVMMATVIKNKSRKIRSLSESLERQRAILAKVDGVKQTAKKEQKIISSGSSEERFANSLKILKKHKSGGDSKEKTE